MKQPNTKCYSALTVVALLMLTAACANTNGQGNVAKTTAGTNTNLTICKEPRPQICQRDYRPVCATMKDAGHKTFSNGCTSCTDSNVVGYVEKPCTNSDNNLPE